jgi:hypothetical protein
MGPSTKKRTIYVLDLYFAVTNSPRLATIAPTAYVDKPAWLMGMPILLRPPYQSWLLSSLSSPVASLPISVSALGRSRRPPPPSLPPPRSSAVFPHRRIEGSEVCWGFCPAASSGVWCGAAPWLVGGDCKGNHHLIMVSPEKTCYVQCSLR